MELNLGGNYVSVNLISLCKNNTNIHCFPSNLLDGHFYFISLLVNSFANLWNLLLPLNPTLVR